ncbi:TIGR03621 family F420-dependent LLM class oxidoreductase [Nitriliruptor alkaliphilus]|uniref:TIGR03621 family F420-dependent LLM class oxidoreductase n=1 Tax=Nitriliruptor alkaliphilus TaxID=427918 RepID=UPI000696FBC5|nr:TIGR03621 family F420-dependent LLM class oxidoreductase [Nitriliruptor alkaliphilus]
MVDELTVSVQAAPDGAAEWVRLARRTESLGFRGLLVADHPGSGPAPFVALAAAAAVTERISLGTYVVNAGAWEPVALASNVATLDVVSGGRAILGVGAGHTPAEWTMRGLPHPDGASRVARMVELTDTTRRLLAGEQVTFAGEHLTLVDARLEEPQAIQRPVPLLVGGNGHRLLRYAAEQADIVALSGLGRTLDDGHRHEVQWSEDRIARSLEHVRAAAAEAGRTPALEALVQHVEVTDAPREAAAALAARVEGLSPDHVLSAPFAWVGTASDIAAELLEHRDRWGISRYVIREAAVDAAHDVLAELP